ncbi:lipopolysaccharide export system protein LptA [Aquamicrobium terrae]
MRSSRSMRLFAAAAVLMAGGAGAALAQSGGATSVSNLKLSNDKPIQIESDKLEVRQNENLAIFSGNVSVVQGPTLLKAGTMKVYYTKPPKDAPAQPAAAGGNAEAGIPGSGNIDHIEVDDKVYIKSDTQVATGDRGTFDMKSQVLVLSGDKVVLSDGTNVLVGCKLTVQTQSGLAQVDSCGKGGRVMMSITPDSQKKP